MDVFLKISVLQANFCWLGDLDKIIILICPWKLFINNNFFILICPWKLENCWCLRCWLLCAICQKPLSPPPPTPTEGVNVALRSHLISYQTPCPTPLPPPKGWILPYGLRLLGNFPVSKIAGWKCTLLAGNLFISLAGSEEQINVSQQSPKMLKIASDIFIHAFFYCF